MPSVRYPIQWYLTIRHLLAIMDPRPAKRQRKLAVSSSDSEPDSQPGEDNAALSLSTDPTAAIGVPESVHSGYSNSQSAANPRSLSLRSSRPKPAPRAPSRTHTTHRAASSSASPEKRRYGKPLATDTAATKSLHSFFQPATEEQRWSQKFEARHAALDPVREKVDDSDDLIEDDYDSYDELFTKHFADRALNVREDAKPSQKRRGPLSRSSSMNSDRSRKLTSSKAFFMPYSSSVGVRGRGSLEEVYREDRRPWAQRFPPSNLDELAVHKRKVADVRGWLENVFTGRDRRVCVSLPCSVCVFVDFSAVHRSCVLTNIEATCSTRPCWLRENHHDISVVKGSGV